MSLAFTGIEPRHFDAYEPSKWTSGRFNLERMRAREQVEALAGVVAHALGPSFGLLLTQDHPTLFNRKSVEAQWALFGRPEAARRLAKPLMEREKSIAELLEDPLLTHGEAWLAIRVDFEGVEVGFQCHGHAHLDRKNAARRVAAEPERFLEILAALPHSLGVAEGADAIRAAWQDDVSGPEWLTLGQRFSRADAIAAGAGLAETVAQLVVALAPVHAFVTWSPENDTVGGVAWLAEEGQRALAASTAVAAEPARVAERPPTAPADRAALSWSYRPDWAATPARPEVEPTRGPSSRVRERAAELSNEQSGWSYSGPVRMAPEAPRSEPTFRDDRGPPRFERPRHPGTHDRGPPGDARGAPPQDRRDEAPRDRRAEPGRPDGRERRGNEPPRGGPPRQGSPQERPRGDRPRDHQSRDDRPRDHQPRDERRRDDRPRDDRPRDGGAPRRPEPKVETWIDTPGEPKVKDHVRVGAGLFAGRIGQVIELTSKGNFKVVVGDFTVEVPQAGAVRVVTS